MGVGQFNAGASVSLESTLDAGSDGRAVNEEGLQLVADAAVVDLWLVEEILHTEVERHAWADGVADVGIHELAGLEVLITGRLGDIVGIADALGSVVVAD